MSKLEISSGDIVPYVLAANANSGDVVVAGQMFGILESGGLTGATVGLRCGGIHDLAKSTATGETFAVGANVHWDATNARATISATSNARLGVAVAAATPNTVTTVRVRLNPAFP
jgi:predicted RecA/RadA family phage recombinase